MEARCMKCATTRKMVDQKNAVAKNGTPMVCGKCEKCGTKMCKFVAGKKQSRKGGKSRSRKGKSRSRKGGRNSRNRSRKNSRKGYHK